jgi:Zn-dependent M28 family amino/carboxypeptidase
MSAVRPPSWSAIQLSAVGKKAQQQVRLAFWGAAEEGLLGATYYVNSLSDDELSTLYANLNFDMLGSPN